MDTLQGCVVDQDVCELFRRVTRHDPEFRSRKVLYLLFCETLNTGFDIGMMYEPLITRYCNVIPSDTRGRC